MATFLLLEGAILAVVPEEIIMLSLGLLWGKNQISFLESLFAIQLGLISANVFMVLIGKKFGLRILSTPPFSWVVSKDVLGKALSHLYRHSRLTIVISRFTPTIRGPVYLAVGISRIAVVRFGVKLVQNSRFSVDRDLRFETGPS